MSFLLKYLVGGDLNMFGMRDLKVKLGIITLLVAFSPSALSFENFKVNESTLENREIAEGFDLINESPLYSEILEYLEVHSQDIADREMRIVDEGRNLSVWGGMNHVGINFAKGFGTFSIELKREVAPDLFDDERWLVTDTFNIYIDATKVLNQLKNDEVIDITERNLAAFAGLTFKRSYTQVHFADDYQRALGFNLDKLFFSFKNFRNLEALNIQENEFIKKEDSFSLQAGGLATAPLTTGLAAHVGALVKYQTMATTTLQGVAEEERSYPGERVRVSVEKEKLKSLGATAGLVADFMGILQMTLLKLDFTYELKESFKTYLSFNEEHLAHLDTYQGLAGELRNIFKGRGFDRQVIAPFLVSEEQRRKETSNFRYNVLLIGGKKSKQTEHIQLTQNGVHKSFFRHNFENVKYIENVFSRFFQILIKSFLKVNSLVNKAVTETKNVRMEYSSEENLLKTKDDLIFEEKTEKLSLNFIREFYAYKLKKLSRERLVSLMDNFSGVDPQIINQIEDGSLERSVDFRSTYSLGHEAMKHFHNLSLNQVYDIFDNACESQRKGIKGFFSRLFKSCEKKLKKAYDLYQVEWRVEDYTPDVYQACRQSLDRYRYNNDRNTFSPRKKRMFMNSCMQKISPKKVGQRKRELPVWRLARLSTELEQRVPSKNFYFQLFGHANVHVHGEISGLDQNGFQFQHYFREGIFQGLGIVNNYKKNSGLRAPASVISL